MYKFLIHINEVCLHQKEKLSNFLENLDADFDIISFEHEISLNSHLKKLYEACATCQKTRSTNLGLDTYLKLLTPVIHSSLEKLLYMDVDVIFNGPIDYIFTKRISQKPLGAVQDNILKDFGIGFKYTEKLKLRTDSPYLNGGILLFNIPLWNNQNFSEKILNNGLKNICLLEDSGGGFAADQPCINFTMEGNWFDLGIQSNHPADTHNPNAKVIHFLGNAKPWLPGCHIDNTKLFYKYLKKSPWGKWKKKILITSSNSTALKLFLNF